LEELERFPGEWASLNLNESQMEAARAAYRRAVTLIIGPPGTGKSKVMLLVVRGLCRGHNLYLAKTEARILVTSQSHLPVSDLAVQLNDVRVPVLRAFAPEKDPSRVLDFRMRAEIPGQLDNTRVVCATLVGCTKSPLHNVNYPIQVLEEAGQATEPACLLSIARGCRQLIMVGDPRQLPPHVRSPDGALSISMLQRLQAQGVGSYTLDIQYRTHSAIADYIKDYVYQREFRHGPDVDAQLVPRFPWPQADRPVCVITVGDQKRAQDLESPCATKEGGPETSYANDCECLVVKSVVEAFIRGGAAFPQIGIITPYGGQVLKLRSMIPCQKHQVEIGSVDAFQGKEKEIIIYSTVRCSESLSVGHVADRRRLTVALSRAKRGLVVVSAKKHLERGAGSITLAPFFDWVDAKQYVISELDFLARANQLR